MPAIRVSTPAPVMADPKNTGYVVAAATCATSAAKSLP